MSGESRLWVPGCNSNVIAVRFELILELDAYWFSVTQTSPDAGQEDSVDGTMVKVSGMTTSRRVAVKNK